LKQKQPIITAIKTDHFIIDKARHQLRKAALRAQYANHPSDYNIEIIDLTRDSDKIPNPLYVKLTEPQFTPIDYMIKISQIL